MKYFSETIVDDYYDMQHFDPVFWDFGFDTIDWELSIDGMYDKIDFFEERWND